MGWEWGLLPPRVVHACCAVLVLLICFILFNSGQDFITVPEWERQCSVDFSYEVRAQQAWVTLGGGDPSLSTIFTSVEDVLEGLIEFDIMSLPLRDPEYFIAGGLHEHLNNWEFLVRDFGSSCDSFDAFKWVKSGVDVTEFFCHFKGNFKFE